MAATEQELALAKQVIDYLFMFHNHPSGAASSEEEYERLEKLFPRPVVDSLLMEKWIKDKYPEVKEYYYGQKSANHSAVDQGAS